MSHLTARDIRQIGTLIDAALAFMQFTGNRDQALQMLLQGTKALLPFLASLVEVEDIAECSRRYHDEGLISREEYGKIRAILGEPETIEAELVGDRIVPRESDWIEELARIFR